MQPPDAANPPEEDAVSIDAATVIRATFAQDGRAEARTVLLFFDPLVELLTGGGVGIRCNNPDLLLRAAKGLPRP